MRHLFLSLVLCALPVMAAAAPAVEVKAQVGRQVHQVEVYAAVRVQLMKDRAVQQQRASELSSKVADAKRNRGVLDDAALKASLRDALEASKALEATDRKLARLDGMMRDALAQARAGLQHAGTDLSKVDRRVLESDVSRVAVMVPSEETSSVPAELDIRITPGMDAEAIQERADLAGDYEDKLRREALRTEARINELKAQASVQGEAQNLTQDSRLFDEEDRALAARRVVGHTVADADKAQAAAANTAAAANGGGGLTMNPAPPPGGGGNSPTGAFTDATETTRTTATGGTGVLPRSQTVADTRTFNARDSRGPLGEASPADELRQLQQRHAALVRQAAHLKAVREELNARAKEAKR